MSVWETLTTLVEKINAKPAAIHDYIAVYHFHLSGEEGGDYQMTIANNRASTVKGTPDEAKCVLELSDSDFMKLVHGTLNPAAALVKGSLKMKGDMGHTIKLQTILYHYQVNARG